jgi:nucleotide-binding universal stress UspA family protein
VKVLLAVDRSKATDAAVAFVAKVFSPHVDGAVAITLFHVAESLRDEMLPASRDDVRAAELQKVMEHLDAERKQEGERLLDAQRQALLDAGLAEADIERKLVTRESLPGAGKVMASLAIIEEMKAGAYDVVCLGRRGASGAAGSFLGSVAEKVLREARGRTVWVVD